MRNSSAAATTIRCCFFRRVRQSRSGRLGPLILKKNLPRRKLQEQPRLPLPNPKGQ
ncbi:hypothetical protein HN51_022662, partial [Arachis hypogaea]